MSFFSFKESLFTFSQFENFTNSVLIKLISASRFTWDANRFVSSANSTNFNNSDEFTISLIYMINNYGPRIDPCGTPHLIINGAEISLPRDTH